MLVAVRLTVAVTEAAEVAWKIEHVTVTRAADSAGMLASASQLTAELCLELQHLPVLGQAGARHVVKDLPVVRLAVSGVQFVIIAAQLAGMGCAPSLWGQVPQHLGCEM